MKRFVLSCLLFTLPIVVLCGVALCVEWMLYRRSLCHPACTIAIIGDSRPACGIDPSVFPELANCAQVATPSLVWKAKLPDILDRNPQIKTFVIEVSPISYLRMPDLTSGERAEFIRRSEASVVMLDLMRSDEMGGVPQSGVARNFILGVIFPFLKRSVTFSSQSALRGGFAPLDRKVKESSWWKNGGKIDKGAIYIPTNGCNLVKCDIEEMIQILHRKGIDVVLMTLPFWEYDFSRRFDSGEWDAFEMDMHGLGLKYGCPWIDYHARHFDDSEWGDAGHLNRKGAQRLAQMMREDWQNGKWKMK